MVQTVVVELTPRGRAAVAVVLVVGPRALAVLRRFFSPVTPWRGDDPPIGRIMLGRWCGEQGEELIVCRRDDLQYEIHCHGGVAAAQAIVQQLVGEGCRELTWQQWNRLTWVATSSELGSESQKDAVACGCVSERRGFHGSAWHDDKFETRRDSTTVAACAALAEATTQRTAAVLLDQYHGALSAAVEAARTAIASDRGRATHLIDEILRFRDVGLHLTTPRRVVIAGPPNVGKSSLINAIAGYQRAIVSPLPGTTRDVVTITTAVNGWPLQIADTAGLRETLDELELAGVALAGAAVEQADLVIVVSDASVEFDTADEFAVRLASTARVLRVANKVDLVRGSGDAPARFASNAAVGDLYFVSALTGGGIAELLVAIERSLVPTAPPAGAAIPFTRSQVDGLEAARAALGQSDIGAVHEALASLLSAEEPPRSGS